MKENEKVLMQDQIGVSFAEGFWWLVQSQTSGTSVSLWYKMIINGVNQLYMLTTKSEWGKVTTEQYVFTSKLLGFIDESICGI